MRRVLVFLAVVVVSAVSIPASWAGVIVSNVAGGILTVTGTAEGDDVTVRCEGGQVTVNQAQPSGGPIACGDLRRILVFSGGGPDRVSLGEVTRSVFDGLASASVSGQDGDDVLIGSDFGDELIGGGGVDSLRGGIGPDELVPGPGGGEAIGGQGRDTLKASGDGNWFLNDTLLRLTTASEDTALSSIEEAEIRGGAGANVFSAATFPGSLKLVGRGGNDQLGSGPGNDRLDGGDGNDWLQSSDGNDILDGRAGDDVLRGDLGNDQLDGGPGTDFCTGGPGADSVVSC